MRMRQLQAKLGDFLGGPFNDRVSRFFALLATTAADPVGRATARYYTAMHFLELADNRWSHSRDYSLVERQAWRQRALDLVTGLSTSVEHHEVSTVSEGRLTTTFARLEADLLNMIQTTTVGGNATDLVGRRLDGGVEAFSAYTGKVLLVDIWATWCMPCRDAFPGLEKMTIRFGDDLQILGVSLDEQASSVVELLAQERLPWAHWHVGKNSEFEREWRITGVPTYILIGGDGTVLNRYQRGPLARLEADVEMAVRDLR